MQQATKDLENYDKERHDEFKRYEMMKEHDRREHLKTLDEDERKKEEEHYEEMKKKHADHPKVNHPVSLISHGWQLDTDMMCFISESLSVLLPNFISDLKIYLYSSHCTSCFLGFCGVYF